MSLYGKKMPGDPLVISSDQYNGFVDAADANNALGAGSTLSPPQMSAVPVVRCYNASGLDAPWRGVVEIAGTGVTAEQVEFVQPGQAGGVNCFGILIEPIPAGYSGFVAVAGGPWEILSAGEAAVGNVLAAQSGFWTAGAGTTWRVLRAVVDAVALVRFTHGGFSIEIRDDDPPPEELWEGRIWYNTNAYLT